MEGGWGLCLTWHQGRGEGVGEEVKESRVLHLPGSLCPQRAFSLSTPGLASQDRLCASCPACEEWTLRFQGNE